MMVEATEAYLASRTDLTSEHAPLVAGLRMAAEALDKRVDAAMMTQYRLLFVQLAKTAEGDTEDKSELATFLEGLG